MTTRNILAALLLMASANMMAETYNYLTLSCNGTEESVPLPVVQKITFEDGYMVVTSTEGIYSYPIANVEKIRFTETATAIEALPEEAKDMTYKDGTLSIKGDGMLRVYNTAGALVSIAYVKEGANINLGKLPAGVYVVKMGEKTIKVKK